LKLTPGVEEVAKEFLDVDWPQAARKGNRDRGRQLFGTIGCAKCHAISGEQSVTGGPSLADAGKRFSVAHLVESILLPSRQVAEQFKATQITTTWGKVITGLVLSETADTLEMLLSDTTRQMIRKEEIDERKLLDKSPMPAGLVTKPEDLGDLLAYLLMDNPLPP
jgi:putative heme-binding domain-containing protein